MAWQNPLAEWLDIAASAFGLAGSMLLVVTAWRAVPLQSVLDETRGIDPDKPGGRYVMIAKALAEGDLVSIRVRKRGYLLAGTVCLAVGFFLSILTHFV